MYKFTNVVESEEFFSTSNVSSIIDRNINNISLEFGESDPFAYISIVSSDDNILTITAGVSWDENHKSWGKWIC